MANLAAGPERDKLVVLLGPEPEARAALARLEADDSVRGRLRLAEIAAFRDDPDTAFGQLDAIVSRYAQLDRTDFGFYVWARVYTSAYIGTLGQNGPVSVETLQPYRPVQVRALREKLFHHR